MSGKRKDVCTEPDVFTGPSLWLSMIRDLETAHLNVGEDSLPA